ncbi:hydrogenase maturation nickel metallochaperone HypA [Calditrichota bacterium]
MHEFSIVKELIRLIETELVKRNADGKVVLLTFKLGKLSGANPDAIRFAFDILAPESCLQDADLDIIEVRPICICKDCGGQNEIDYFVYNCPSCKSDNIFVEGGTELFLESVQIDN